MFGTTKTWAAAITLMVPFAAIADEPVKKPEYSVRSIIRKGIDDQGRVHGDLAQVTGLANATSLAYKVLLVKEDGTEANVDAAQTTFQFGQQFRIEIEADSDLYVYVFHEGPNGTRTILMPDSTDNNRIPMVRRGQKKVLPDDGTYFEFVPPAGVEKLLVYASPERRDQLTPKDAFENVKDMDKKKMIELKNQQDKVISDATKNQPKETVTAPDIQKVVQSNEALPEFRLRGMRWQPEGTPAAGEGQTVMVGSYDPKVKPDLFVEISLQTR